MQICSNSIWVVIWLKLTRLKRLSECSHSNSCCHLCRRVYSKHLKRELGPTLRSLKQSMYLLDFGGRSRCAFATLSLIRIKLLSATISALSHPSDSWISSKNPWGITSHRSKSRLVMCRVMTWPGAVVSSLKRISHQVSHHRHSWKWSATILSCVRARSE